MPGGTPTVKHKLPELGSFLARKRRSLAVWCENNGIKTESDLQKFINQNEWALSEQTLSLIRSGFSVISSEPSTVSEPLKVSEIVVLEQKIETVVLEPTPVVVEPIVETKSEETPVAVELQPEPALQPEPEKVEEPIQSTEKEEAVLSENTVVNFTNNFNQLRKKGRN